MWKNTIIKIGFYQKSLHLCIGFVVVTKIGSSYFLWLCLVFKVIRDSDCKYILSILWKKNCAIIFIICELNCMNSAF